MLKKDTIKKLKDLGIKYDEFVAAIKADDEQDFELPTINNLTEDQLAERDKQVIAAAKPDILKEGKNTGIEIANKAIAKKFNLTDVDTKDPDKVIAALEGSVAKGDTGLKEQIALLQRDKETLSAAVEAEKGNAKAAKRDADLISHFPAKRAGMTDKQFLALVKMELSIEDDNGVEIIKKDGVALRDPKTQSPIALKDAVSSLFADNKWVDEKGTGGRGGGDNLPGGGAGIKKFSQAEAQYIKDNPNGSLMSPAFTNYVSAIAKESPEFSYED